MKIDVRNSDGTKLGTVNIQNLFLLRRNEVCFARAKDFRYFEIGFLEELPLDVRDYSFAAVDMRVSKWVERPSISQHGQYHPGRVDFCLIHDQPLEILKDIRGFEGV